MRTRRSWRNQERLWRDLFGPPAAGRQADAVRVLTDDEIDALPFVSRAAKAAMKRKAAGDRARIARRGG